MTFSKRQAVGNGGGPLMCEVVFVGSEWTHLGIGPSFHTGSPFPQFTVSAQPSDSTAQLQDHLKHVRSVSEYAAVQNITNCHGSGVRLVSRSRSGASTIPSRPSYCFNQMLRRRFRVHRPCNNDV